MRLVLVCRAAIALLAVSLLGCGSDLDLRPVRGTVQVDGAPYPDAHVVSFPDEGPVATGMTNEAGEFDLSTNGYSGAVVGQHTLTVSPNVTEPPPIPGQPIQMLKIPYDSKLRSRHGSTLKYEVGSGDTQLSVDLTAGNIASQ